MKKENLLLGAIVFIAVLVGVMVGNLLMPAKEVQLNISAPEGLNENLKVSSDSIDLPLGRIDSKKFPSATSSKVSVGGNVRSLFDLMYKADSSITRGDYNGINRVIIQPEDTIRYQCGTSDLVTDAGFSTGTTGGKVFNTWQQPIACNPSEIYIVRDSGTAGTVTVQVVEIGTDR